MTNVLPWLVCWTRRAGKINLCTALSAPVSLVQNFFLTSSGSPVNVSLELSFKLHLMFLIKENTVGKLPVK
jgi:hypothetical protein